MPLSFEQFESIFKTNAKENEITIQYINESDDYSENIDIYLKNNQFYCRPYAKQQNEIKATGEALNNQRKRNETPLTKDSLANEHRYIAAVFSGLPKPDNASADKRSAESFKNADSKLKWLLQYFLLDTWLVGGLIGYIIASVANRENKYYTTIPSSILRKTLGPLIFPAGSKKPMVANGIISIDSILHNQYTAFSEYNSLYTSPTGDTINFHSQSVPMKLQGTDIYLNTIIGCNSLVEHLEPTKHPLVIIYFNGNSGCFQQDYKRVAEDLLAYGRQGIAVKAVQFNYPGVLPDPSTNSDGGQVEIAKELIDAGIAQVEAILKTGIPHANIVLHGVSLGGSIASHVGAHFHRKPKENNSEEKQTLGGVYASRTFASTTQVGRDFLNRALGDNIISRFISTLCLPFIKIGTWGSGWDLDTGKAFFSLPRNKRNYSVILSPKDNRDRYHQQNQSTRLHRVFNFILRHRKNPADDAILGRGLHDAWEKKIDAFLVKWGFYGKKPQQEYSEKNRYRKMMVVDFKTSKPTLKPGIDGHVDAFYCYPTATDPNNQLNNPPILKDPARNNNNIGLVHRTPPSEIINGNQTVRGLRLYAKQRTAAPNNTALKSHEAGAVARDSILEMSQSIQSNS